MRALCIVIVAGMLAGCGPDAVTTAATGAEIEKQELEQGKKTEARMRQKIDQAMDQLQQRAQQQTDENAR